ncbi:hypothetical protein [Streptomyces sp. NPDC057694]|uniref:hypothetical protein n=1 Tax=Streptomyces sp. NPDC057694 TaxID=3346216 RepID=UPI0036BE2B04
MAAAGWKSTDTFNGSLHVVDRFRTLGQKASPEATEHRLPDLGDEAAVLIKGEAHGLWSTGPEPWQAMVRVRAGNALFVTTYAEESATRAHTTKAAEAPMRNLCSAVGSAEAHPLALGLQRQQRRTPAGLDRMFYRNATSWNAGVFQ